MLEHFKLYEKLALRYVALERFRVQILAGPDIRAQTGSKSQLPGLRKPHFGRLLKCRLIGERQHNGLILA